jgi:ribosomal protein L11 methyltransferase
MDFIQLNCRIESDDLPLAREIVIQELADLGFESFEEAQNGVVAYIPEHSFDEKAVSKHAFLNKFNLGKVEFSFIKIEDRNWNDEWEKNFQPVLIAETCFIRAPFHEPQKGIPYEIIIEPKMAFGTGNHETTSLMIEQMLAIKFEGKHVLDMGCGTGVLGIMASKLKATSILAIDIDEWAYQNTIDNCAANNIKNIAVEQGNADKLRDRKFDVILANINRNILLEHIPAYANSLSTKGLLLLSGIYEQDLSMIREQAEANSLIYQGKSEKNNWIAVLFAKNE